MLHATCIVLSGYAAAVQLQAAHQPQELVLSTEGANQKVRKNSLTCDPLNQYSKIMHHA